LGPPFTIDFSQTILVWCRWSKVMLHDRTPDDKVLPSSAPFEKRCVWGIARD
jgi:hypothetical protein